MLPFSFQEDALPDSLDTLAEVIRTGLPGPTGGVRPLIEALFGSRYHQKYLEKSAVRDA